jgi:type IV pilus assembly protein PilY1
MMHAFDGSQSGSTAGQELFAYVPSFLFSGPNATPATDGLAGLANPTFVHHYYVDGQIGAFDIDFNKTYGQSGTSPNWHSMVVGGLGKGGKGYYALDVTTPSFASETALASKVLWEFTDSTMGYSFGIPLMVKTKKYGWVAIFTSGYSNSDGVGRLYIVNPYTGAKLETISTGVGSTSAEAGLAHAVAFVNDYTDGTADAVYAGDLLGNVWRFDLTGTDPAVPYPTPTLFAKLSTGCSGGVASGTAQPVTTTVQVAVDSANTRYVMVGTGRLLDATDITNNTQQTFYVFIDGNRGAFNTTATRYPIAGHCLTNNANLAGVSTTQGWYYDMTGISPDGTSSERVNVDPTTSSGLVFWAGNIPSGDPCSPTGSHYDYVVALSSGKTVQVSTTDSTTTIEKSAKKNGLETQAAFLSVSNSLELYELTDQGDLNHVGTGGTTVPKMQQLNWREIPATDQ